MGIHGQLEWLAALNRQEGTMHTDWQAVLRNKSKIL
jgi:hypothetical protein